MTKQLITLMTCAALGACSLEREPDHSGDGAALSELQDGIQVGSGSGSGSGSGDPTPPPPPPEPETCTAGGDPSPEQLEEAKKKLKKYLNGCSGQKAVDKILDDVDKNKDGKLDSGELTELLKKVGLGGSRLERYFYCQSLLKSADANKDGKVSGPEIKDFLDKIGLGGPDQCVTPPEHNAAPRLR